MEDNGKRMFDVSLGLVGQRGKIEAHFVAYAMPDQAWQPNAIAKIMQFDGYFSIHLYRRNLTFRKFHEHTLRTDIDHTAVAHGSLSTADDHRQCLLRSDRHTSHNPLLFLSHRYRSA